MRGKPKAGRKAKVGERTHREIAVVLGVSHGTVVNDERSALRKIREHLTKGER